MRNITSKVSVNFHTVPSASASAFLLVISAHWLTDNFEKSGLILSVVPFVESSSAQYMANCALEVLKNYGIEHKILGFTFDGNPTVESCTDLLQPSLEAERAAKQILNSKQMNFFIYLKLCTTVFTFYDTCLKEIPVLRFY